MRFALLAMLAGALFASPALAQYKMKVDPNKVDVARGESVPFDVTYDIGRGWKNSRADEWYTLLQPAGLGKLTIQDGRLVFTGEMAGTGKLHIWHRSKWSWSGLYVILPVTVRRQAAPPRPRPRPRPIPRPGAELLVMDANQSPANPLGDTIEVPVDQPSIDLMVHMAGRLDAALGLEGSSSRNIEVKVTSANSATATFRNPRPGDSGWIHFNCSRSRAARKLTFRFTQAIRADELRVLAREGFEGPWRAVDKRTLLTRPGGVVFLRVEYRIGNRWFSDSTHSQLATNAAVGLRRVVGGVWLLAVGEPGQAQALRVSCRGRSWDLSFKVE